jgi:hypothetical protein
MHWIVGLAAALLAWNWLDQRDAVRAETADGSYTYPGYTIAPLESFQLTGRILSARSYRSGREAELSPVDLAIGWDEMAKPDNIAQLDISQRNRWMYWKAKRLPLPRRQLESSMANVHIIPASADVAEQVQTLAPGTLVTLDGDLVQVNADDGWRWRSSLSRTDTGARSCEVLWLTRVQVL